MSNNKAQSKMVKATSHHNMVKMYTDAGYKAGEERFICPHCDHLFRKAHPKADNTTTLYNRAVRKVVVFAKEGKPSVAACACGFRRSDKPKDDRCLAVTTKGKRCRYKAVEGGFCKTHSPKAAPQVVENEDGSASIHGPVSGVGF